MYSKHRLVTSAALFAFAALATAQVDTGRPKAATAICKDGTFYSGSDQATACKKNGGLQEWWGTVTAPKGGSRATQKPGSDPRQPYDKAEHPTPTVPPAGQKP